MIGPKSNWASWRVECCKKWMTAILQISWMIKFHNFQTVFVGIKTKKTPQLRGQFRQETTYERNDIELVVVFDQF